LKIDTVGAFIDYPLEHVPGPGPLHGLTLAVKDLFDVEGLPTGGGHPLKRQTSDLKPSHAPVVARLLDTGARLLGKTHTDEFAYSMNGENPHYGTPINPRAPGRIPGGSSSGSAAAVAAGLADIALGTDTGGSIRLPASYCGLVGLRTTHGAIDISGVQPLAPSFDTVGWFARDMETYRQVAHLLLPPSEGQRPERFHVATDIADFVIGDDARAQTVEFVDRLSAILERGQDVIVAPTGFEEWRHVFRTIQAYEVWAAHGDWILAKQPEFGHGVKERFQWAQTVTRDDYTEAQSRRAAIASHVAGLIPPGTLLAFPTAPAVAPLPGMYGDELEAYRLRSISMLCTAGLSGLPQLSLPLSTISSLPFGQSLLGWSGSDHALLDVGSALVCRG
jgi:amidase